MALTDTAIRNAKPKQRQYKIYDGSGLFLIVTPNGGKWWRHKFRINGKEKLLSLGIYPETGLKDARTKRDEARKILARGADPSMERKREAFARSQSEFDTFASLAAEFIEKREREGLSEATLIKAKWFASLLDPGIGKRPVKEIEPFEVLEILKAIERRGNHETAKRVRAFAARIFRYAIITGRAKSNPAADLGEALISPTVKHHAAILDRTALGALMRAIESYDGAPLTQLALRLTPHVFVRPGELRQAEWDEIDFDAAVWRIPARKMKMRNEHAIPLSWQSLEILRAAKDLRNDSRFVFPSLRSAARPMSENTVNAALRRLGYSGSEVTAHGFRSTASTLLNESGKWSPDAIERALAHKDANAVRGIYHRGAHWNERVAMAQWWSDLLDHLRDGGEVVPFRASID